MKKVVALLIIAMNVFSFSDLGKWGELYPIAEKIEWKDKNSSIVTQAKINKAINRATTSNEKLPACIQSKNRYWNPTVTLEKDISMPKHNILVKKGTKFNPLDYGTMHKYMLLVDASDSNQTALAEHYKLASDIIVFNGNISTIKHSVNANVYIATKSFTNSFKPVCLPSFYIQQDKQFLIKEINMKDLSKEQK